MQPLTQKRVLVVGGSSGIGLAIAQAAAEAGGIVTIASRSVEKLRAAAASSRGSLSTAALDTADLPALEAFFEATEPWDHIAISAAQTKAGPLRLLPMEDARAAMESKFWGAYRVAHAAKLADDGSLTFISGFLSERPSADLVLQGAINAALEALARGLALEFGPVRVNTVSPGLIETPVWNHLPVGERASFFDKVVSQLPVHRIGKPNDVANAVLFLMTTPFATGTNIRVDGGGAIA